MAGGGDQDKRTFSDTPEDWQRRWDLELQAAEDDPDMRTWRSAGDTIVKRFLDKRGDAELKATRLNLFYASVAMRRGLLYGRTPKVEVSRRFADAKDDAARVASEALERCLNADIDEGTDGYSETLEYALEDHELPGLGCVRVRYEVRLEQVQVEAQLAADGVTVLAEGYTETRKVFERAYLDYVHWRDVLWGSARVWPQVPWIAYKAEMSREDLHKRFDEVLGPEFVDTIPMNGKRPAHDDVEKGKNDPWARAEVWEVWDKETKQVFWLVRGFHRILDRKDDPLGLEDFFPSPKFWVANPTTTKFMPRPNFALTRDLYDEIDTVVERRKCLAQALVLRGVYDGSEEGLKALLDPARRAENVLIPVKNWPAWREGGGMKGAVEWLPLEMVVGVLTQLGVYLRELKDMLYEVEGTSDILRGQATNAGETATAQGIKANFGGARLSMVQDEFARFASAAAALKAEVVCKHFDAQTILERANLQQTEDAALAPQAVELLKSRWREYRVAVKPEQLSMQDFAALRNEGTEFLTSSATFMQAAAPLAQQIPGAAPHLMRMLQWFVSRIRGAGTIEGVLDQAIAQMEQAQQAGQAQGQQQGPPPKTLEYQAKTQGELATIEAEKQADLERIHAEMIANRDKEEAQYTYNMREAMGRNALGQARAAFSPRTIPGGKP